MHLNCSRCASAPAGARRNAHRILVAIPLLEWAENFGETGCSRNLTLPHRSDRIEVLMWPAKELEALAVSCFARKEIVTTRLSLRVEFSFAQSLIRKT